jgi:ABC-2 type transport system permease protein
MTVLPGARTVMWKEVREQYMRAGHPAFSFWFGIVLDIGAAIALPLIFAGFTPDGQVTEFFVPAASFGAVVAIMFLAVITPLAVVVDLIAGERERHTLETLLATPLSDRAILWGKMGTMYAAVALHAALFGVVFTVTMGLFAGLVGVLAGLAVLVGGIIASLLVAGLMIGVGILISLKASTVKQGQQWMAFVLMPLWIAMGMAGPTGLFGLQDGLSRSGAPALPSASWCCWTASCSWRCTRPSAASDWSRSDGWAPGTGRLYSAGKRPDGPGPRPAMAAIPCFPVDAIPPPF